jgi:hypothetical protein
MTAIEQTEYMDRIPVGTLPELRRIDLANGKQARVVRVAHYEGATRECVAKYCGGEHHGYTLAEALMLIDETKAYRAELEAAGVKIPINHRMQPVQYTPDNSWQIVMVDEMHGDGEDLKQKLKNGYAPDHKRWIMLKILEFLDKLPDGMEKTDLITCPTAVLGDFKPDNWVLEGNDTILIDYFGPKRWKDGLTSPYLPKMDALLTPGAITFLCGDRRGQFSRIIAMAKRDYPETYEFTRDMALTMLKYNHPEAYPWVLDECMLLDIDGGSQSKINQLYQVRPAMFDQLKGSDAV